MMSRRVRRRTVGGAAAMAVLALVAAGCGGDDPEPPGQSADGGELVTVRVGDILGTPAAFLQFGVDQGFFEEQGLDVQVEPNPGGAANIPGVAAGDFDIAGSNVVSVLLARGEGIPIKMISAGTFATNDQESDFSQILVTSRSRRTWPAVAWR
jgi:NitT/TauT family transport system substrate-binding protein